MHDNKPVSSLATYALVVLGIVAAIFSATAPATAQVPQQINYQGFLTASASVAVNQTLPMSFALYSAPSGGSPLWTEVQMVPVANGVFNVMLGKTNPILLPFTSQYYLGITVGGDAEMTPRQPLTSVPYALRAGCNPGDRIGCYTGDPATAGVGLCSPGIRTCNPQGTGWSACLGEVVPNCNGACVNVQSDAMNCGMCGIVCAAGEMCLMGACVPAQVQCGNGVIQGAEACDDGNGLAGDGCSTNCQVELGFMCAGQPSSCFTSCGDGIIAPGEHCDDANFISGDGCSACLVESGFQCVAQPSVCQTFCGDGIVAGAEPCDGQNLDGQTCQSLGFTSGSLSCVNCNIDTSACVQ